jgi:carbamate kinase
VIACGGGGIPVVADESGDLHGVEAVIDKDLASSMLARELNADLLVISTSVARVAINFGRPEQRWLERLTRKEAQAYLAEGHFAEGSMAPKVRAIVAYLDRPGRRGLITDPPNIGRALRGEAGTEIGFD